MYSPSIIRDTVTSRENEPEKNAVIKGAPTYNIKLSIWAQYVMTHRPFHTKCKAFNHSENYAD